jgi:hypothetical protein
MPYNSSINSTNKIFVNREQRDKKLNRKIDNSFICIKEYFNDGGTEREWRR